MQIPLVIRLNLLKQSRLAAENAYAPVSRFPVGAAFLLENGDIHTEYNVENGSLGLVSCAERIAIQPAVLHGNSKIRYIAITCCLNVMDKQPLDGMVAYGVCLQSIQKFVTKNTVIIIDDGKQGALIKMRDLFLN